MSHRGGAKLRKWTVTSSYDAKGTNGPGGVGGESDEDDKVNKHESDDDGLEVVEFGVFVFDGKAVEGTGIEIYKSVDDEDN